MDYIFNSYKKGWSFALKFNLIDLSQIKKQLILIFIDILLIILVLFLSFSVRLGYWYVPENLIITFLILFAPLFAIPIFKFFGLYRIVIRYFEVKALVVVIQAVSIYALLWGVLCFLVGIQGIPRSVILINWVLSFIVISGVRFYARNLLGAAETNNKKRVLIYGAGEAGVQLVSSLTYSKEFKPLGFIDDNKALHGRHINGLSIFSVKNIKDLIKKLNIHEIFVAIPSASRSRRLDIINELEPYPVLVKILPAVSQVVQGKVIISDLREVDINDLLGRDAVLANKRLLSKNITNKVVIVTGGGGSIGSELSRQILGLQPKVLILYETSELALYNIEKELSNSAKNLPKIYPILGSINNINRFSKVLKYFKVQTIYHTAAYKHVPMVEFNNSEGVKNNVFGTLNCAQAAIDNYVETFVLISTDKAVRPTNTMGATKRCAELILQALNSKQSVTKFSIVRFGNVLGSSGSVIPLFKEQIKNGGPLTVTDKDVFRYFMTIKEAVQLVIQAGAMGKGGDVFVLDMGLPVKIKDLAEKMIRLSGLEVKDEINPNGDIEIQFTGLRAGEKLYEELIIGDDVNKTENPLIMVAMEDMLEWKELEPILNKLNNAIIDSNNQEIRKLLMQIVPGFKPKHEVSDLLHSS
jgi:FlaA1/EpsC-like NDP-sugar epimerase